MSNDSKLCPQCQTVKSLDQYYKDSSKKDGLQYRCKACFNLAQSKRKDKIKEYGARYYQENKEYLDSINRIYQQQHKDEIKIKKAEYYIKNRDHIRQYQLDNANHIAEYMQEYRIKNRDRLLLYSREYMKAHKEHYREYRRTHPEKARARTRNRRAIKRNSDGTHAAQETRELFARQSGRCHWCNAPLINPFSNDGDGEKAHLDHVIPLKRGGRNDIGNLVWACQWCNTSKGAKLPEEWIRLC